MIRQTFLLAALVLALRAPAYAADESASVAAPPAASEIIADVSTRHIAVTAGFNGADTTLFGALPENGDVIVTVTGPEAEIVVRRKEQVLGVWLNRNNVVFGRVPGFYWYASSRPLTDIAPEAWLASNRIGSAHLRFNIDNASDYGDLPVFQAALLDLRMRAGLYASAPAQVTVMGGRLYRADVHIPADAPTGEYILTTYLLQNGQLIGSQRTPLTLRKEGTMSSVSVIAERNAISYAILVLALALLTGWTSAVLMQRS